MSTIIAEMRLDWVEPYCRYSFPFIPIVIESPDPVFSVGMRLDYGLVFTAVRSGYRVEIRQTPESLAAAEQLNKP